MAWPPAIASSDSESCTMRRVIEGCVMQTRCDVCQQITIQAQISSLPLWIQGAKMQQSMCQ